MTDQRAPGTPTADDRLRDQSIVLGAVVSDAIAQLDEIRLPLQILLENSFGELNDNQEELLRDARAAADAIDVALRRLRQVADADRDDLPVQTSLVQVNDVIRSVLPLARSAAERSGARTETSLEPGLPRVVADRARLAEALALLLTLAASATTAERPLRISTERASGSVSIRIAPFIPHRHPSLIVASRLIEAQNGSVTADSESVVVAIRLQSVV